MELKIKEIRKQKGFTVDKLSKKLNIVRSTLTHYENGNRDIGTAMLCQLADVLGVSVDELLGREKKEPEVIQVMPGADDNLSDNKKQLIEIIKELSEEDLAIISEIKDLNSLQKIKVLAYIDGLKAGKEQRESVIKHFTER